jgi:hypothetical protein
MRFSDIATKNKTSRDLITKTSLHCSSNPLKTNFQDCLNGRATPISKIASWGVYGSLNQLTKNTKF